MAKISRMVVGQTLWEVTRQKMGNTTVSRGVLFSLVVTEIDPEHRWVVASWNGNRPQKYWQRQCNQWKVKKPEPKGQILGYPNY